LERKNTLGEAGRHAGFSISDGELTLLTPLLELFEDNAALART